MTDYFSEENLTDFIVKCMKLDLEKLESMKDEQAQICDKAILSRNVERISREVGKYMLITYACGRKRGMEHIIDTLMEKGCDVHGFLNNR